jgi:hypothetical protein
MLANETSWKPTRPLTMAAARLQVAIADDLGELPARD